MEVKKSVKLVEAKLNIMLHLMEVKNADFRKQSYEEMAEQVSKEFNVCCTAEILEKNSYLTNCNFENWEVESRKVENNYYNNSQYYEDRNGH